jgi:hypothetical protein
MFANEKACDAHLVAALDGVICARCSSDRPYELKTSEIQANRSKWISISYSRSSF